MDRARVKKSEALREAIRRLRITNDDAVLDEVAALRRELDEVKADVGRLKVQNRHLTKKVNALKKFTSARIAYDENMEKARVISTVLKSLDEANAREADWRARAEALGWKA